MMSPNTQAILLLTAPLGSGGGGRVRPLGGQLYGRLALRLRELGREPAELLTGAFREIARGCAGIVEEERVKGLMARGAELRAAAERWRDRGIWVVSRADGAYPRRLKQRLGGAAPPVLYGCGEARLLAGGGLAVVGSREVGGALIEYAEEVGRSAAGAEVRVVSGGARGVDRAAVRGAMRSGGSAVAVVAESLERARQRSEARAGLRSGRLAMITPYDPEEELSAGRALGRNKLIYALGDAALVVQCEEGRGGTWAGATEQLERLRCVRVYVRSTGERSAGIEALQRRGAVAWPNPRDGEEWRAVLRAEPLRAGGAQTELRL